jgi:hypothetical protein
MVRGWLGGGLGWLNYGLGWLEDGPGVVRRWSESGLGVARVMVSGA